MLKMCPKREKKLHLCTSFKACVKTQLLYSHLWAKQAFRQKKAQKTKGKLKNGQCNQKQKLYNKAVLNIAASALAFFYEADS